MIIVEFNEKFVQNRVYKNRPSYKKYLDYYDESNYYQDLCSIRELQ